MKFAGLTLTIIAIAVISVFAQNKEVFENDLNQYMKAYNSRNWDGVMSMIYPKLFTFSDKQAIVEQLANIDSSGLALTFSSPKINKTSGIVTVGKESFCILSYNCQMKMVISGKMLEAVETLKSTFEAQYGVSSVKFDKDSNTFDIDANLYMYAVSADKGKTWKYLEKNDSMSYMFDSLIPKKVLKKFENFK